jgi:hypothetical protein
MSEENSPKRQRSVINPVKMVNLLREEKGLPKILTKAKTVRITPELKKEIAAQELARLFPEALTQANYEFNEEQAKRLVKEVEFRLAKIRAGKEVAPEVEGSAPAKRRGRPPRNA